MVTKVKVRVRMRGGEVMGWCVPGHAGPEVPQVEVAVGVSQHQRLALPHNAGDAAHAAL